jgi:hypothetical protein
MQIRFDSGARLARVKSSVLAGSSVKSIVFPSSVRQFSCMSLTGARIGSVTIADGRQCSLKDGGLLLNRSGTRIIRYLGHKTNVVIRSEIQVIGESAFEGADQLDSLTFTPPLSLRRIEANAFLNSSLKSLFIPASVVFIDGSAFGNCSLDSVVVSDDSQHFKFFDSFLVEFRRSRLVCYLGAASEVVIPNAITILGSSCFCGNETVQALRFAEDCNLTEMEHGAFEGSTIHSLVLPSSLTVVSGSAFIDSQVRWVFPAKDSPFAQVEDFLLDRSRSRLIRYLGSAPRIVIPPEIEVIGDSAFESHPELRVLAFDSESRVTHIEANAFCDSQLENIDIPASVQFIDPSAFENCPLKIVTVAEANKHFCVSKSGGKIRIIPRARTDGGRE